MTAVAIFVKTPGYSPIKTRLASDLGQEPAEDWHRRAALAVAELAERAAIGPVYFAVAEPEALGHPLWSALPNIPQGPGGLGARMGRIHGQLIERHGSALLLGADTIQWQIEQLRQAGDWQSAPSKRWTIGPASDGGFWTFGSNHALPQRSWTSVTYSRADTRAQFERGLADSGDGLILPTLTDLDPLHDLPSVLTELRENRCSRGPALESAIGCLERLESLHLDSSSA